MTVQQPQLVVTSFYRFFPIAKETLSACAETFQCEGDARNLRGLLLLANEGVNATLSGDQDDLAAYVNYVSEELGSTPFRQKTSSARKHPFPRLRVRVREEIVTYERKEPSLETCEKRVLSPARWREMLRARNDITLLDVRNYYEVALGKFRNAIDPKTDSFLEFREFLATTDIPRDKPVLMYCTGGIRCEKAALDMRERGFAEVYELDGGILNYLAEFPDDEFEGECFVFDGRVSLDQHLKPSQRYHLCPHCGDPGALITTCENCGGEARICDDCARIEGCLTCSKNCAYHARLQTAKCSPDHVADAEPRSVPD